MAQQHPRTNASGGRWMFGTEPLHLGGGLFEWHTHELRWRWSHRKGNNLLLIEGGQQWAIICCMSLPEAVAYTWGYSHGQIASDLGFHPVWDTNGATNDQQRQSDSTHPSPGGHVGGDAGGGRGEEQPDVPGTVDGVGLSFGRHPGETGPHEQGTKEPPEAFRDGTLFGPPNAYEH